MARIRTIKPAFFTDHRVADLPLSARLTFIGLWTYVDDDGRGLDDARLVKGAIWPLDDAHTTKKVESDLKTLADRKFIVRYEAEGRRCLAVSNWSHQRINRPTPSTLPAPSVSHDGDDEESSRQEVEGNREVEEGGAVGESSQTSDPDQPATALSLLTKAKHASHAHEVDAVVLALTATHGADAVEKAVQTVDAQIGAMVRYSWPSDIRKALEAVLGPAPADAKPSPFDDTAAAARRLEAEGNEQIAELREIPVDPNASSRLRSIRDELKSREVS